MTEEKAAYYYALRFASSDAYHQAGEEVMNAANALRIGQTENCDVRLVNDSPYEDEVMAVVERNDDGKSWRLIRLTPYYEVRVNGTPIDYVHYLSEGDRIGFSGQRQELTFHVRNDQQYNGRGLQMKGRGLTRRMLTGLILFPLLLVTGLYFWSEYSANRKQMQSKGWLTEDVKAIAEKAVYKITVDSVRLCFVEDDSVTIAEVLSTFHYGIDGENSSAGTAFVTADSLLVTARHCIEPWLNDSEVMDSLATYFNSDSSRLNSVPTKWALRAVTENELGLNAKKLRLVSYCSLYHGSGGDSLQLAGNVVSTDFVVNISRDDIAALGGFVGNDFCDLYWRSLAPTRRLDMRLGDFAFAKASVASLPASSLPLATRKQMKKMKAGRKLFVVGYPHSQNQKRESIENELALPVTLDGQGFPDDVLAQNGPLTHGYSGGPVVAADSYGCYVVGIVSVIDAVWSDRKYSVPVTEIEKMRRR